VSQWVGRCNWARLRKRVRRARHHWPALAGSLAGLVLVNVLSPGFSCILASMPFISDLRTGSMSGGGGGGGGGGEATIASAAAAQLVRVLDLPSTVFAGITDANTVDAQAGYEGYTVALAAHAGTDGHGESSRGHAGLDHGSITRGFSHRR